jgi:hypothetical protein
MRNLLFFSLIAVFIITLAFQALSYTSGSPSGYTGSPADKRSCAVKDCHSAQPEFSPGMIISTIGSSGYIPGNTYSMVATVRGETSSTKFGFQISPQSVTGQLLGKMSVINPSETSLSGKGKYINQRGPGVSGKGSRSWSFKWTAPPKGTGPVTFYGCFLSGGKTEKIYTSTLTINEAKP